jgi:geranylgeranyl diphosphate synthase type II
MKTFDEILSLVGKAVEQLDWSRKPEGLYDPIVYTLRLGGKRLRPALTIMACEMFDGDIRLALKPALGLEVFHNFTLLHDDIMDKADIRRGQSTVHVKWSSNHAVLSGDLMQIYAYMLISEAPATNLKQVLDLFSETAREVCEGQQYDMDFEIRSEVAPEEYLEMIRLKTAVLLGCALKMGALIAGAKMQDANRIYDFGINLGIAFQLKDDLLDVFGNEKTFGKKIGGDILCNKKTFLLIHALKADVRNELDVWLQNADAEPEDKIAAVTSLYNQLGVRKICEDAMLSYYEKAIANLENIGVEAHKKQELRKLAEKLMHRND